MTNYKQRKIFLGIDPGYADMGYGVIVRENGRDSCLAYGSLRTAKDHDSGDRLKEIYEGLVELINKYQPSSAAIEKLFFSKNTATAMKVAEARGVILMCLTKMNINCVEIHPLQVKVALCGHGKATKPEMQKMISLLLGLKEIPKPDDAADALALALSLANSPAYYNFSK